MRWYAFLPDPTQHYTHTLTFDFVLEIVSCRWRFVAISVAPLLQHQPPHPLHQPP